MKKFFWAIVSLLTLFSLQAGCGGRGTESHGIPNAFSFTPRADALLNDLVVSEPATISGINIPVSVHVEGGEYSLDDGPYTSSDGTVQNGQKIRVRHTTPNTPGAETITVLTIGGVVVRFTSTTGAVTADTVPEPFSFDPQIGVPVNAPVTWPEITVTGVNTAVSVRITGEGEPRYSVDNGPFTAGVRMVNPGQKIAVRQTSAATPGVTRSASLTIGGAGGVGGVTGTFSSTTAGTDQGASFALREGVPVGVVIESNAVVVPGPAAPVPITVSGGEYSINGGDFTSSGGVVSGGQTVKVRHTSSVDYSTPVTTVLTIGERTYPFTSVTIQAPNDIVPDSFSFDPPLMLEVAVNTEIILGPIAVLGINAPVEIKIVGGEYSIDGGDFTAEAGTVRVGQTVRVRQISAGTPLTRVTTTLRIGGVAASFSSWTQSG